MKTVKYVIVNLVIWFTYVAGVFMDNEIALNFCYVLPWVELHVVFLMATLAGSSDKDIRKFIIDRGRKFDESFLNVKTRVFFYYVSSMILIGGGWMFLGIVSLVSAFIGSIVVFAMVHMYEKTRK